MYGFPQVKLKCIRIAVVSLFVFWQQWNWFCLGKRNTDSEGEEVGSEKVSKILSADDYDVDPNWKPTGTQVD